MIITIDGPTASGKSSAGRTLAKKLGYYYIYSGLLYRAIAYLLIKHFNYTLQTIAQVKEHELESIIDSKKFVYQFNDGECIKFNHEDITPHLKDALIDQAASLVSTNPMVRSYVDQMQKIMASEYDAVVDGRDAGTQVFPNAEYKFFLTAKPEVRAKRWQAQQKKRGEDISLDDALEFISIRDTRDSTRDHAPLKKAEDAIEIDNSDLSLEETINRLQSFL